MARMKRVDEGLAWLALPSRKASSGQPLVIKRSSQKESEYTETLSLSLSLSHAVDGSEKCWTCVEFVIGSSNSRQWTSNLAHASHTHTHTHYSFFYFFRHERSESTPSFSAGVSLSSTPDRSRGEIALSRTLFRSTIARLHPCGKRRMKEWKKKCRMGGGSKFTTTECRTTEVLNFQNSQH